MADVAYILVLIVGLPAAIGWSVPTMLSGRRFARLEWAIVPAAAAIPAGWLMYATWDADAISSAAAVYVAPVVFLISSYFAFMAYRWARHKNRGA